MKKILLLFFLCFIFSFANVKSSANYNFLLDNYSYDLYSVSINNLNTKNFFNFFKNINVIRIYPKINPIYKNKIGDVSYDFSYGDILDNINRFSDEYLSIIKKNSYFDYNYLYLNGINIDRVLIYINGIDLYKFISNTGASVSFVKQFTY